MEQGDLDEYWTILETSVKLLTEAKQRMIAYKFCLLIESNLDDLGTEALILIKHLTLRHVSVKKCESYQNKLQQDLPGEGLSLYNPLIWSLQPHAK